MSFGYPSTSNEDNFVPTTSGEVATPTDGQYQSSSIFCSSTSQPVMNSQSMSVIHNNFRNLEAMPPHDDHDSAIPMSPSSSQQTYVISGSWDSRTGGWEVPNDVQQWQTIQKVQGNGQVLDVVWSDDGTRIFTTSSDKTVKVWDLTSNQAMPVLDLKLLDEMECEAQSMNQNHQEITVESENHNDPQEHLNVFRSTSSAPPVMSGCPVSLHPHLDALHSRQSISQADIEANLLAHSDTYQIHPHLHSQIHHGNGHPLDRSLHDQVHHHRCLGNERMHQEDQEVSGQYDGHSSSLTPLDPVPIDLNVASHQISEHNEVSVPPSYLESTMSKNFVTEQVACDSTTDLLTTEVQVTTASTVSSSIASSLTTTSGGHKLRDKIAKSQQQQLYSQNRNRGSSEEARRKDNDINPEDGKKQSSTTHNKVPVQHKCETCGKCFPRFYSLRRHQIMHSGEKKFKCPICNMSFSHVYNRNRHVKRHVNRSNPSLRRVPVVASAKRGNQENLHGSRDPSTSVRQPMVEQLINQRDSDAGRREQLTEQASESVQLAKPYRCGECYKSFTTEERLAKHAAVHSSDDSCKPFTCVFCEKKFLNNSALSCHLKVHNSKDQRKYDCILCKKEFDCPQSRKNHIASHADPVTGRYTCNRCKKTFLEFNAARKHIRGFHSDNQFPCNICQKIFSRQDKLKLHMLRHSDLREFLCQTCGKQFKRKDKLKEHMKRMHAPDREARMAAKAAARAISTTPPETIIATLPPAITTISINTGKKFIPKVSPNDYHRFIYKCHTCLLGFKRRGMLVNHLAKRHPETPPDAVPELNLPILKTTRDYYCQYCDKVYKSSSKRKSHILKNHPGKPLPMSNRQKGGPSAGLPNPTFSAPVGSITTHPHYCNWCHKQYASKAKLLQHQRKKHVDYLNSKDSNALSQVNAENSGHSSQDQAYAEDLTLSHNSHSILNGHPVLRDRNEVIVETSSPAAVASNILSILGSLGITATEQAAAELQELLQTNPAAATDLLTQAMNELSNSQGHQPKEVLLDHHTQHNGDVSWT